MTKLLQQHIANLSQERLAGMRRGIEKEGLRALSNGSLALTPHPQALGSAFTHSRITTDFSESQLELVTGVHPSVQACLDELGEVHQFVHRALTSQTNQETMWAASMPCSLPTDETIPLGRYGSSNSGRSKSVYRMGLGHRYGRRMQTISVIHYYWSLPGVTSEEYFGLIRNFRRHAFILLYLFGASPALCPCFVEGRQHSLQPLGDGKRALYLPYATSLRMGRLGYQSDAQATLAVSYNGLEGYANSLHEALTRPYPTYETIGIRNPGGEYNQLGTSLLQIENEFYGTIRPKRVVKSGERPLHALRERGVEYVEVRLMDLNPFESVGISTDTMRVLDVFLLHCLFSDSPPDTPAEIADLKNNQHLTAERGREPGLQLVRGGKNVSLSDWGQQVLEECLPIAAALDAAEGSNAHTAALQASLDAFQSPDKTPSAQVLRELTQQYGNDFIAQTLAHSEAARDELMAREWTTEQHQRYVEMSEASEAAQRAIEKADDMPFEAWRERYMSVEGLG